MKTTLLTLSLFILTLLACDKVEPPYIEGGGSGVTDNKGDTTIILNGDTFTYFAADTLVINGHMFDFSGNNFTPFKKVLMEEWTGFKCGNCPPAGIFLNTSLAPPLADTLVVVGVHAGQFAEPGSAGLPSPPAGSFLTDYRTAIGDFLYTFFNSPYNPSGMIDRVGYPSSYIKNKAVWSSTINTRKALPVAHKMDLRTSFDAVSRKVSVAVQTELLDNSSDTLKLQVVLTEDSVLDWQYWDGNNPIFVSDFAHRHVLRTSLIGNLGEVIYNGTFSSGEKRLRGYTATLPANWMEDHCRIVSFISDKRTEEVYQVEEVHVVE
ncbi:MAG: Omp28-related outer membrane protein [Bacteroidota bacterium]